MSTISFGAGSIGLVIADAAASKSHLDQLTEQASSGLAAPSYGGLSRTQAAQALSLRPLLIGQQAVRDGIDAVQSRMNVAQTALGGISSIASTFYAKVSSLNGLNTGQVDSVAADARDALRQVAGLLDTQEDGVYVFAGDDAANPPVPDPDQIASGPFATAISAAVAGLGANGAASTIAATLAVAGTGSGSVSPFSTAITSNSVTAPVVSVGVDQTVTVGVVAGSNGAVVSEGSSTTGSYTRDILRALATLGSLSSGQVSDPDFSTLTGDIYTSLGGALTALNQDAGVLGDRQTALAQTKTTLSDMSTALTAQVSGAEQVDMTATLSQLTQAQTQLQSSYQVIASLQSLSLTRYLTS